MLFRELLLAFPGLLGPITAPTRSTDNDIMRQISASLELLPEVPSQSAETVEARPEAEEPAPRSQRLADRGSQIADLTDRDSARTVDIPVAEIAPAVDRQGGTTAMGNTPDLLLPTKTFSGGAETRATPAPLAPEVQDNHVTGGQSSQAAVSLAQNDAPHPGKPGFTPAPKPPAPAPEKPDDTPDGTGSAPAPEQPGTIPDDTDSTPQEPPQPPTEPVGMEDGAVLFQAEAGRVAILQPSAEGDIAGIRILTQGEHGHVSVNPDNSLALVLSEDPNNTDRLEFRYEVTFADGRTQEVLAKVDLSKGQQDSGWGQGNFYMLEEGQDGQVVVEHGDNHRKVYVTAGDHGLSRADIARAEGIAADKVTAAWLVKNPKYGATEDMALDKELGMELWYAAISRKEAPTSNWLLFERGHDYGDVGRLIGRGSSGESALHPIYIGTYGDGSAPVIDSTVKAYQNTSQHVVVQGLELTNGVMVLQGENLLFDQLTVKNEGFNLQNISRLTLRDSTIIDVFQETAKSSTWHGMSDRISGAYISGTTGTLLEGLTFDHSGWQQGYDYNLSASKPQAPSMYSHNLYIQFNNLDVTVRDTILMRGASYGMQLRSGGVIEDVVSIDNNASLATIGGNYGNAGYIGNYSLFLDSLVTSAGHKKVAAHQGALSMGLDGGGRQTSMIGNIVAHLADPNNAAEIANKTVTHFAVKTNDSTFYNDTIVYNWAATAKALANNPNQGINGADTAVLDQTTIQNFTAQLLGKQTATIADLADYLRDQAAGKLDHMVDADLVIAFFKEGFGVATDLRAEAETLRFAPDVRADGMRWDNRLNWSTGDLPGTQDGDSVDLGGNKVLFGAKTTTVDDFIFGDHGQLKLSSGRLDIQGEIDTGSGNKVQVTNAGQLWFDGYHDSDRLVFNVEGGRLANTGDVSGRTVLGVGDQGQALLAVSGGSFDLGRDSSLTVTGGKARVGFDGADSGPAVLRMQNGTKLNLVADETGIGKIAEFRSGAFGETSKVTSGVALDGTLKLNLADFKVAAAGNWTLIDADQIIGKFDDLSITGLGNKRDALVRVDYIRDEVILVLGAEGKGSGQVRMNSNGDADFINHTSDSALKDLWQALHSDAAQTGDL